MEGYRSYFITSGRTSAFHLTLGNGFLTYHTIILNAISN